MLTSHELCTASGLTYRELDNWIRCNVIPVAAHGHTNGTITSLRLPGTVPGGSGYPRYFTERTTRIAAVLKTLRPLLGLDALRNAYAALDALDPAAWPTTIWITEDGTAHKRRPTGRPLAIWIDLTPAQEQSAVA